MMTLATILIGGGCMLGAAGHRVGAAIAVLGIFVAWFAALLKAGGAA